MPLSAPVPLLETGESGQPRLAARVRSWRRLCYVAALLPVLAASCTGLDRNDQGRLQPQTVRGPCQVKKFFILDPSTVPVEMTVGNVGEACSLMIFNPDLQIILSAVLVTAAPAHGTATASLATLRTQAAVSYTPQPGYSGRDRFTVTLEPNGVSLSFAVTVQPGPLSPS